MSPLLENKSPGASDAGSPLRPNKALMLSTPHGLRFARKTQALVRGRTRCSITLSLVRPLASMNLRQHKGKLATGVGILALMLVIMVWLSPSFPFSSVRLTFLYMTNHPQVPIGGVGVFELVNPLNESISSTFGHYKSATRSGVNAEIGDRAATFLGARNFAPGSTNIVQIWSPTNGGPYKLVLQCLPASKDTSEFYSSARVRIASFVSPWVKPSFATQARWYGSIFVESQAFEPTP